MKMKNKSEKDYVSKKNHKALIEASKKEKREEVSLERKESTILPQSIILIVCEGRVTERTYLEKFKLPNSVIRIVAEGYNTLSLVKRTVKILKQEEAKIKPLKFNKVWCVFDADLKPSNPKQMPNFKAALDLAKKKGFEVAYSHQAVEYWFILHFEDHQGGPMDRKDYHEKFNKYLIPFGCKYEGEGCKEITQRIFDLLQEIDPLYKTTLRNDKNELIVIKKSRQQLAIERAHRIYQTHELSNTPPEKAESSTTVYKLIQSMLGIEIKE